MGHRLMSMEMGFSLYQTKIQTSTSFGITVRIEFLCAILISLSSSILRFPLFYMLFRYYHFEKHTTTDLAPDLEWDVSLVLYRECCVIGSRKTELLVFSTNEDGLTKVYVSEVLRENNGSVLLQRRYCVEG